MKCNDCGSDDWVEVSKKIPPKILAEKLVRDWFYESDTDAMPTKDWALLVKKIVKLIKEERK